MEEGESAIKAGGINEATGKDAEGGRGGVEWRIVEKLLELVKGEVDLAAIAVRVDEEIVGDYIGANTGLGDESVEG